MRSVEFKYINLKKAYLRLKEVSDMYDAKNDIIRDSLIQRFEFTYELTHKTLKEFMKCFLQKIYIWQLNAVNI